VGNNNQRVYLQPLGTEGQGLDAYPHTHSPNFVCPMALG
jgi:hypothetical protein